MARPPKIKPAVDGPSNSGNNNGAVVPATVAPKVIDIDNFVRVRDSVYARLSTIQDLIKSFSADYLRQTNLLLGEGTQMPDGAEIMGLDNALNLIAPPVGAPQPGLEPTDGKKERKKRQHDPNAPKRPLTPYFLYMQTARPIIATDLGPDAAKGAVQEEGQRRWGTMSLHDKSGWDQAYQYNLRLYNARVHAYKQGGDVNAKAMSDDDALKYAELHAVPMPNQKDGANDQDQIAQQLQQLPVVEEPSPPPAPVATPAKTPKSAAKPATGGRKRKSTAATPAAATEESAAKASTTPAAASPAAKRKRTTKAAAAAAAEEKEPVEPKKSGRKKAKAN